MGLELPYVTLDVFTTQRYRGNPLAVVTVPASGPVPTQEQRQLIAREFNYSETVFVQDADDGDAKTRRINIFLTDAEVPFAGHPTIGTAVSLLPQGVTKLVTRAGPVSLTVDGDHGSGSGLVRAAVPHDTRLHARRMPAALAAAHPVPAVADAAADSPVFSIVNGMSSVLVSLPSLELLAAATPGFPTRPPADQLLDEGWQNGDLGVYYYHVLPDQEEGGPVRVRTRFLQGALEDPATGSAASSLACYLTISSAGEGQDERTVDYQVTQGVEMGRESNISVRVVARGSSIQSVSLGGTAVQVMRGFVTLP